MLAHFAAANYSMGGRATAKSIRACLRQIVRSLADHRYLLSGESIAERNSRAGILYARYVRRSARLFAIATKGGYGRSRVHAGLPNVQAHRSVEPGDRTTSSANVYSPDVEALRAMLRGRALDG